MNFILGLLIALASIAAAIFHLKQDLSFFWDFVAFVTVFGGTLAVFVVVIPWHDKKVLFSKFLLLFKYSGVTENDVLLNGIDFIKNINSGNTQYRAKNQSLSETTLKDAAEMISLGMNKNKILEILSQRIEQDFERSAKIANSIRSLAKYPPAFGLAGTVLGLVTLMRKVSEGIDTKETGVMMAIALMATFYGLLISNLIINPAGEYILKLSDLEKKKAEISLQAVSLALDSGSLLESQEVLNSLVADEHRVNVLSNLNKEEVV